MYIAGDESPIVVDYYLLFYGGSLCRLRHKACQAVGRLMQPKVLAAKRGLLVQLVNRLCWTTKLMFTHQGGLVCWVAEFGFQGSVNLCIFTNGTNEN